MNEHFKPSHGAAAHQPVDLCGVTIFVQQDLFYSYVNVHFFFIPQMSRKTELRVMMFVILSIGLISLIKLK